MLESGSVTTIEEIAESLREQRDQGQASIIFLGARASEFYRNAELYREVEQWIPEFQELSDINKFRRCYEVLSSYYNEQDIHRILSLASKMNEYRDEDGLLVKMVQAGFINKIITTHIGTPLENAFIPTSLKEPQDYQVIIPALLQDSREIYRLNSTKYCRIFRIFGDLESHQYQTAGRTFNLEKDRVLKGFLESELQNTILLIGHDSAWDRGIEPAFLPSGGTLWYVNEEAPPRYSHLARILQQRPNKYLIGPQGDYIEFIPALYEHLGSSTSLSLISESNPPEAPTVPRLRNKVFISYSRTDSRYLDRFEVQLRGLLYGEPELLSIWSDRDIQEGDLWEEKIKQALESASVAVLLVSADFLASKYIRNVELPLLLQAAREGKVTLLSFVLSPCNIKYTDLAKYQIVNDMSGSFCKTSRHRQESLWRDLAQQVFNLLHSF